MSFDFLYKSYLCLFYAFVWSRLSRYTLFRNSLKRRLEQQLLVANNHTGIEKFMQALIVIILLTISDYVMHFCAKQASSPFPSASHPNKY